MDFLKKARAVDKAPSREPAWIKRYKPYNGTRFTTQDSLLSVFSDMQYSQGRIQGYREALAEAGLSMFENVVVAGANETDYVKPALDQLLTRERRPSAIFAVTQKMTAGALQAIAEAGFLVPNDISLLADCVPINSASKYGSPSSSSMVTTSRRFSRSSSSVAPCMTLKWLAGGRQSMSGDA